MLQREAAQTLGITRSALAALAQRHPDAGIGPSHQARYGAVMLALYTPERVRRVRTFLAERDKGSRPLGIPVMWSPAEMAERRRAYDRARKTIRNAAGHRERDDGETADAMEAAGRAELERLAAERERRKMRRHIGHR